MVNVAGVKNGLVQRLQTRKWRRAKARFESAAPHPYYLPTSRLSEFVERFGKLEARPHHDYSPEAMSHRGRERAEEIWSLCKRRQGRFLEIGPGDGMVLKSLMDLGASEALGVDIGDNLQPDARSAGVSLLTDGAEDMRAVASASFDVVYSFSAYEHISEIEKATAHALRVLKPGGTLLIHAGPLFYSPWGYHFYSVLRAPYIHLLFPEGVLHEYAAGIGGYIPPTSGNRSIRYFNMIENLRDEVRVNRLETGLNWWDVDLVSEFAELFRAKRVPFEEFFIDTLLIELIKL